MKEKMYIKQTTENAFNLLIVKMSTAQLKDEMQTEA